MTERKRIPCNRICDCEWGSKTCMQKRGYIWNYVLNRWSRGEDGKIHRTAPEHRECDYVACEQLTLDMREDDGYITDVERLNNGDSRKGL